MVHTLFLQGREKHISDVMGIFPHVFPYRFVHGNSRCGIAYVGLSLVGYMYMYIYMHWW